MPYTSTKDTEFGDCYFVISKTDKRLIGATLKTFQRTGTYVFLKLFEKTAEEYEFQQRISLTLQEFVNSLNTAENILESEEQSAKDCSSKPLPNKRPKLQHEIKYGGSNIYTFSKLFQIISATIYIQNCCSKANRHYEFWLIMQFVLTLSLSFAK